MTTPLYSIVFDIFDIGNAETLKSVSRVTQGRRNWYHSITDVCFLLAPCSNFVSKMHYFWDIRLWKVPWHWNPGQRSLKVYWKWHFNRQHMPSYSRSVV